MDYEQPTAPAEPVSPESSPAKKKPRRLHTFLAYMVIASLVGLALTLEVKRQESNRKLAELTNQIEGQDATARREKSRAEAKQIVEQLRKHISLPTDVEPTVATIVDVDALRDRNPFYNNAKNGDHLVVTANRAIIYDSVNDVIRDVVPVQIQPVTAEQ